MILIRPEVGDFESTGDILGIDLKPLNRFIKAANRFLKPFNPNQTESSVKGYNAILLFLLNRVAKRALNKAGRLVQRRHGIFKPSQFTQGNSFVRETKMKLCANIW